MAVFESSTELDVTSNVISPAMAFEEMLKNMYTYLKATRELTQTFNESMVISHENIWVAMVKAKKHK